MEPPNKCNERDRTRLEHLDALRGSRALRLPTSMFSSAAYRIHTLYLTYSMSPHTFFFFLNLYKATFVCLSVVYMGVDTVYGCERLCGKT
jgi:hypothetical protein